MAICSGFSLSKWWFSIAMLVHQRVSDPFQNGEALVNMASRESDKQNWMVGHTVRSEYLTVPTMNPKQEHPNGAFADLTLHLNSFMIYQIYTEWMLINPDWFSSGSTISRLHCHSLRWSPWFISQRSCNDVLLRLPSRTLPSGKLSHNHGKIHPFFMGKSTISMVMFNSYMYIYIYICMFPRGLWNIMS